MKASVNFQQNKNDRVCQEAKEHVIMEVPSCLAKLEFFGQSYSRVERHKVGNFTAISQELLFYVWNVTTLQTLISELVS